MGLGGFVKRVGKIRVGFGSSGLADLPPPSGAEAERIALRRSVDAALDAAPAIEPIEDPVEWEARLRAERAARDEVRGPFLAPDRAPVAIARIAASGRSQWDEVCRFLAASGLSARPDLVFGAYPVPDSIDTRFGDVVEWDVVHAAAAVTLEPGPLPVSVRLPAEKPWVLRPVGGRVPLDEDLAITLLTAAGMGPERTLGMARDLKLKEVSTSDSGTTAEILAQIVGVGVLVPAGVEAAAVAGTAERAPLPVPESTPPGFHVAVLDWWTIHRAVQPARRRWQPMPSPVPHLPSTAQELLQAYLDIVGIAPLDCFGVQVTYDEPTTLNARDPRGKWMQSVTGGDESVCADGKARKRWAGGAQIVVAYRDDERYREGRERFDAYARGVLGGSLDRAATTRRPVPKPPSGLLKAVDTATSAASTVGAIGPLDSSIETPPRYCWPPAE
jgi:hypothetical protein